MGSARTTKRENARPRRAAPRSWLAPLVGFLLAAGAGGAALGFAACSGGEDEPSAGRVSAPGADQLAQPGTTAAPQGGSGGSAPGATTTASPGTTAAPTSTSAVLAPDAPYDGPFLGAMAFQTPIYPEPRFSDERAGYIRQGGKVPVKPGIIKKPNCKQGWYELVEGGFVCGKYA
ncbi:MAG: hypothetical protein HOV80_03425, partial [Polyangiaceae bacterium]|nr:hypothetical protein [Polyangiaceae bacterium]